ncbi:TAXI family TRAP transporter solute-binding subunit [Stella sp.]|uniref:TAXI family TRAP transporter solute-binding subunit n=1 Tax=Stella sp. TaxID=2912054 RepID=UPI0035AF72A5
MQIRATAVAFALVLAAGSAAAQAPRSYILTTATTGGTYYPVGVALATLAKVKLQTTEKIDISAISSAGSTENVKLMRENQAQMGIILGLVARNAWDGKDEFAQVGPQKHLRGITSLWSNVDHHVQRKSLTKTGTLEDLKLLYGRKYSMGARNSGLESLNKFIFPNLGVDYTKFDLVYQGYGPSADSFNNGQIDGTNASAGIPVASVTQIFAKAGKDAVLLEVTDEELKKLDGGTGLFFHHTIKAGTYPGLEKDVKTSAYTNFLAVNDALPENDVYLVTKTIYENLPFLNNIHASTKEMSLERAMSGVPLPLHPGATKYYREKGLTIPARLIAN